MKKMKKIMASIMAYLMIFTFLPLYNVIALAEDENIDQYLNYNTDRISLPVLYKDKMTYWKTDYIKNPNFGNKDQYGNYDYSYYVLKDVLTLIDNGEEKVLKTVDPTFRTEARTTLSENAIYELSYMFKDPTIVKYNFSTNELELLGDDFNGDLIPSYDECVKAIKSKYNLDDQWLYSYCGCRFIRDKDGNAIVRTMITTEKNGIVDTYIVLNQNNKIQAYEVMKNENYELLNGEYYDISYENGKVYIISYDCDSEKYSATLIKDGVEITSGVVDNKSEIDIIKVIDNKLYASSKENGKLQEYVLRDGVYTLENQYDFVGKSGFAIDINGEPWIIQRFNGKSYVSKIEEGKANKVYEVLDGMDNLSVYDENNMVVSYRLGYTHITREASPDDNNNGNDDNNNGGNDNTTEDKNEVVIEPEVNETIDGTTKVEVGSLTEGVTNIVEATVSEETSKVEVTLTDVETIKKGEGAVTVKLDNENKINLPFKVLSEEDLDGATEVTVEFKAEENNAITDGLKAVNKVFSFELLVTKEEGQVSVHNFADGEVEVTLALSDKELEGLDRSKLVVLYYNEETKEYEEMDTVVDGNNVTFKTPHFSKFIVAEKEVISDDEGTTEDETVGTETEGTTGNGSGSNGSGSNNNGATGTTTGTTNTGSTTTTTNKKPATTSNKLVATGTVASTSVLTMLGLILSGVGATLFVRRR